MNLQLESIGEIESCYSGKFGTPRQPGLVQSALAKIKISEKFQPELSLEGLQAFSHLWVIFIFHLNQNARFHAKVHPPRLEGETMGVFATRSPHRPNPLGLSLVEIVKVESDGIWVRGADIVQGTPVLDIKPYLPFVESQPQAQVGWLEQVSSSSIEIGWQDQALADFEDWAKRKIQTHTLYKNTKDLIVLVEDLIKQDPRPVIYRGYEGQDSPYRNTHVVMLYNFDIHFRFTEVNKAEVFQCQMARIES